MHLHQPVGNFEGVFKFATEQAYLPFLRAMKAEPEFRFAFHASGPLWEYWDENWPEIFDFVKEMTSRDQIELLGGGFYEPILAVIPRRDAIAQIEMMSDFLHERFNRRPRGIWLTERIWEPQLPSLLVDAGVEFTITDDYHFKSVGITGDKLLGHYSTEDAGKRIDIFPVSEDLRYSIPFAGPEESVEFLIRGADVSGRRLFVFGDDGEKFGLWPGTHKWVWDEGWMKNFVEEIIANRDLIKLTTFGDWIDKHPPMGTVYLPTISYFEMSEWTLPSELSSKFADKVHQLRDSGDLEDWRPFLKGGYWRGFLAKYPESAWMHKRMLRASKKILENNSPGEDAKRALYRAQCNCAYWHGVFGGLYLPHLRRGVFDNIIRAERLAGGDSTALSFERDDIDCDGFDEVFLGNGDLQVFIKPSDGGKIYEIDIMHCERNIVDTLSRRPEGYHGKVQHSTDGETDGSASIHDIVRSKEAGLQNMLHYDWFERKFLVDHILEQSATPQDLRNCEFRDLGDFASLPFDVILGPERIRDTTRVVLRRNGGFIHNGKRLPLNIEKTISLDSSGKLSAVYELKNPNAEQIELKFAVETHLSLMSRDNPAVHFFIPRESPHKIRPGEMLEFAEVENYALIDEADGFALEAEFDSAEIWMFPIETVSNSESGFERVYQETSLVHIWQIAIKGGASRKLKLEWNIRAK